MSDSETYVYSCDTCSKETAIYLTSKERKFLCESCAVGGFEMVMYSPKGIPFRQYLDKWR